MLKEKGPIILIVSIGISIIDNYNTTERSFKIASLSLSNTIFVREIQLLV